VSTSLEETAQKEDVLLDTSCKVRYRFLRPSLWACFMTTRHSLGCDCVRDMQARTLLRFSTWGNGPSLNSKRPTQGSRDRLRHSFETPFTYCAKFCALQRTNLTQLLASERFSRSRPTDESTAKLFFCNNEPESDEGPLRNSELGSVLHFTSTDQVGLTHDQGIGLPMA
jgi:hypothetical protein